MQNQNYNRQGSNYYQPQQQNYPQQPSGQPPYQPNQMSNYQQPPGQQPPYGQPPQNQPPYGQQPSYGPPQGNMPPQTFNPNRDPNQTDIPNFKLIGRGKGIDEKEYYVITHSASNALNAKEDPLSNGIIKKIKAELGGEWMVFASVEGLKGYDFSLSIVTGNDFLSFTIQNGCFKFY